MHTFNLITLTTAILATSQPVAAQNPEDRSIQVNFYKNGGCNAPTNGEAYTYRYTFPHVGHGTQVPDCFSLEMPGDSKSIGAINPRKRNGGVLGDYCLFYDDWGCQGNKVKNQFVGTQINCMSARSKDGYLWKSAWCSLA